MIEKGYSKHTVSAYITDIRQFFVWAKISIVANINLDCINAYLLELKKRDYQKRSINRKLAALSSFMKYFHRRGDLAESYSGLLEFNKCKKVLPKPLSKQKLKKIFQNIYQDKQQENIYLLRDFIMMKFLYYCGLRVSELVDLKRTDVNIEQSYIKILGKGLKERLVPFSQEFRIDLQSYFQNISSVHSKFMFSKKNGKPLTRQRIWEILKKWSGLAGVIGKVSPHNLRHSFATNLLENDVDLRFIQELLGHSNISTTEIYTDVSKKRIHKIFKTAHPRA